MTPMDQIRQSLNADRENISLEGLGQELMKTANSFIMNKGQDETKPALACSLDEMSQEIAYFVGLLIVHMRAHLIESTGYDLNNDQLQAAYTHFMMNISLAAAGGCTYNLEKNL